MVKPVRAIVDRRRRMSGKKVHRPDITIVDLKSHIMGRAASIVAKQLLMGRRITVVRCDELNINGTEIRNKIKYLNFLRKKKQTNPKKGPFHLRAPSAIFSRCVRSMLPRYTKRGQSALRRLVAYEGVPSNVAGKGQRVVIPRALRRNCLLPERKFTILGDMCQHIGWKYREIVAKKETARKAKAERFHTKKAAVRDAWMRARVQAVKKVSKENLALLKKFNC